MRTLSIFGTRHVIFDEDLSNNALDSNGEHKISEETRVLNVSKNSLNKLTFLEQCPNLLFLDASDNNIKDGLPSLSTLIFITKINFSKNIISDLTEFPLLSTLKVLDLSHNLLESLKGLPELPFLEELDVSHNSIVDLDLISLNALKTLNISNNKIEKLLLPSLHSLRTLIASNNGIKSVQEFEEEQLPFLWEIDLRNNEIDDFKQLEPLKTLPLLYSLSLTGNAMYGAENNKTAPVLVILPTLCILDGKDINAKDKVKAMLNPDCIPYLDEESQAEAK